MISTDRLICKEGSAVSRRMIEYGNLFGELHIILFSLKSHGLSRGQISPNVWVYPTDADNPFLYIFKAIFIGRTILRKVYFGQTAITAQDPFETGIVGFFLKWFFKFPLQLQLHTDAWSVHFQYATIANWIRVTVLSRITLPYADGVRVVTEKVGRDATLFGHVPPKNISVLPVYIEESSALTTEIPVDLHKKFPDWNIIILMVSRLEQEKNISLALKVFKSIHARYPHAGLVIVGSGTKEVALRREVRRLALGNSVSFEGFKLDTSSYFETADIFLNTSLYEGYGMTLIEAGIAKKSVVTTKVGIAHDVLIDGKNAFVCGVNDSTCLQNKLINLIENPHLQKTMGEELRETVKKTLFSKEAYLQNSKAGFDSLFS